MGDSAPRVAEFTGRQTLHNNGLDRQGHHFAAADFLRPSIVCIAPIIEEVPGAPLVDDVGQRATRDKDYHDDDVRLHDDGWYGRRKPGEGIAG